jgi:quercetin dioxygenase-like cupin family protein
MQHWNLRTVEVESQQPQILATTDDSRAIVLKLVAGEELQEHQVHERAWLVVADGDVEVRSADGESVTGGPGLLFEFAPQERHTVRARSDARLLLVLTPWPGDGHPGAMSLEQKHTAREHAAERAQH